MRIIARVISIVIVSIVSISTIHATHNRAGEITYEQIDDLTIRATITTFTRTSSFAADRDSLELFWGDGTFSFVRRSNGNGEELPNDVKKNTYIATHTYPTRSRYKLSVTDPNRIAGIQNIDFPNSVNIQFYLETNLTLLDRRFQGNNSSAILLQPPIDFACTNQTFVHNPNAFDPDGDSLAYELIPPFQGEGEEVPNYNLPDEVAPSDSNRVSLDPVTGDFVWENPPVQGDFNITILIKEYRNGLLINEIIRDMQILVLACFDENLQENNIPTIETVDELCVIAGELIEFDVLAQDIDTSQRLILEATGAPLLLDSVDVRFNVIRNLVPSPHQGTFRWQTSCDDIAETYYQIVFKVTDNFLGINGGAATLKTVRIKILGPSPEDVIAEKVSSSENLISWQSPYACDESELFQGFSVWRRSSSTNINIDSCVGGLEGLGYQKVIFLTNDVVNGRYQAIDADVPQGDIYCYRVVAEFAQLTDSDNLYNQTASLPSEESCLLFNRQKPYLTKVSVQNTDSNNGTILTTWILPSPDEIDTVEASGPFTINLERGIGLNPSNYEDLSNSVVTAQRFIELTDDTTFLDQDINTTESPYSYVVSFQNSQGFQTNSSSGSSIFLTLQPGDESLSLDWSSNVPWNNEYYLVYEIDNGVRNLIDSVNEESTIIRGLNNGQEYCFVIEGFGNYGVTEVAAPLINLSQEACGAPRDNEPPCLPSFDITTACEQSVIDDDLFTNVVRWSYDQSNDCEEPDDLAEIVILYSPTEDESKIELDRVNASLNIYEHDLTDNISGCYAIQAIDFSGNVSATSSTFCVDNCPSYMLPNTFTPNDDGSNDIFTPTVNRFIDRIEFEVYNRWGQVVYRSDKPSINWDGTNLNGTPLKEGTYFYTCIVFESRVSGVVEQEEVLKGYIQIII